MSYALAKRIKELRLDHKVTQEQMAEVLDINVQKYIYLEDGKIDISFGMIKKISDYLKVPTSEITKVELDKKNLAGLFKEECNEEHIVDSVEKVEGILKVFHAHEKLYYQMKEKSIEKNKDDFMPTVAIPPGETIKENMEFLGMNQKELAESLGISSEHLKDIIDGTVPITNDIALKLESVIGPSAQFWMRLENNYQLDKVRLEK